METGLKAQSRETVSEDKLAKSCGSGEVAVYGTPFMLALMEEAANKAVKSELESNQTTVGISFELSHLAPTPVGMEVKAEAELIAVDDKRLSFKITAYDEQEKIGEGKHQRYIINQDSFEKTAKEKRK